LTIATIEFCKYAGIELLGLIFFTVLQFLREAAFQLCTVAVQHVAE